MCRLKIGQENVSVRKLMSELVGRTWGQWRGKNCLGVSNTAVAFHKHHRRVCEAICESHVSIGHSTLASHRYSTYRICALNMDPESSYGSRIVFA